MNQSHDLDSTHATHPSTTVRWAYDLKPSITISWMYIVLGLRETSPLTMMMETTKQKIKSVFEVKEVFSNFM